MLKRIGLKDIFFIPRRAEIARGIRGASDPAYDGMISFRFQENTTNGEDYNGDWIAAEHTNIELSNTSTPFRIRCGVEEVNNKGDGYTARLEARYNGGSWFQVTTTSTYIKASTAANGTDGTAITNEYLTGASVSFQDGEFSKDGETAAISITNNSTEVVYTLELDTGNLSASDYIEFRTTDGGVATYCSYTYGDGGTGPAPKVTIATPSLDADPDSYTYTGFAATLAIALIASPGSYTYTGVAATFEHVQPAAQTLVHYPVPSHDPIKITGNSVIVTVPETAGPTAYSLDCDPDAYTYTGVAATLDIGLTASPGSYAYTGVASTLDIGLAASPGSYTYTGFYTARDLDIAALPGSYTKTGVATTLDIGLTASPGSYTYTGVANTLDIGLTATPGSYTYTGFYTARGMDVAASPGSYTYTGASTTLDVGLVASPGSYTYTGVSTTLDISLTASPGSYVYTGVAADLESPEPEITADPGSYTYTGFYTARGLDIAASPGSYAYTGTAAALSIGLTASPGSYTYTGFYTARGLDVSAAPGSYAYTGFYTARDITNVASPGTYTYTGVATTLDIGLTASPGSYTYTGVAADLEGPETFINAEPGSYTYTGVAATLEQAAGEEYPAAQIRYPVPAHSPEIYELPSRIYTSKAFGIEADPGLYTYTGADATLEGPTGYIHANAGSYSVTGVEALLVYDGVGVISYPRTLYGVPSHDPVQHELRSRRLDVVELSPAAEIFTEVGNYTITGVDAATLVNYISVDAGSYGVTGADATLVWQGLPVDVGGTTYAVQAHTRSEPIPVSYITTEMIPVLPVIDTGAGSYAVTGYPAQLHTFPYIHVIPGLYTVGGVDTTLVHDHPVDGTAGAYTYTGAPVTFEYARSILADPGLYTVTGVATDLGRPLEITASPAAYAVTGVAATLETTGSRSIIAETGLYLISGMPAGFDPVPIIPGPVDLYRWQDVLIGSLKDIPPGLRGKIAGALTEIIEQINERGRSIERLWGTYGMVRIQDGVEAPDTQTFATIYVDDADGDLKIRFVDGTVKTITTDT